MSLRLFLYSTPFLLAGIHSARHVHPTADTSSHIAGVSVSDTIPSDTSVTVGTLPNGLRYYIKVNHKPEHRAELRLVVKAGSLMEDEDQRGGAHFIEHMAFRGTTHYSGTQLVEYLKSIGVGFGSDLNASTEFDRTTFILPIPTDTLAQVQRGLQILGDWAHGVTIPKKDMEDERGIILGERRTSFENVNGRISEQVDSVIFKGSRYADRDPIGILGSVDHMTRDALVRFYQKWYRPDRMAVIVVGDFDKAQMIQMVTAQFSAIPKPTTPNPTVTFPIPLNTGLQTALIRDTELTQTNIMVTYKGPMYPRHTIAARRASLVRGMFDNMLDERLQEITLKPNSPFLSANVSHGNMFDTVSAITLSVDVANNGAGQGVDALLTELARVQQHGFTQTELDRQKISALSSIENAYQNRGTRFSAEFVDEYIENFTHGDRFPTVDTLTAIERVLIPSITLADVNAESGFWKSEANRSVVVTEPLKSDIRPVDMAAIVAKLQNIGAAQVAAYVDHASTDALLDPLPTPGKIVAVQQYQELGLTRWTLSNGVVVFLKPTTFSEDEILVTADKRGGASLISDADYPGAAVGLQLVGAGGLGHFSSIDLGRKLTGKVVGVGGGVEGTKEELSGSSNKRDLETMFQLLYLKATQPRFDSAAMTAQLQQIRAEIANRSADPMAAFMDTVTTTLSQHSKRVPIISAAILDSVDLHRAVALYKDRFADANGFTFVFVGSFDVDSLRPLVERYIASLPTVHRTEDVRDLPQFHAPPGIVTRTVIAGKDPKAVTIIRFSGPYENTAQHANDLQMMTNILGNRLQNRLREELGGTYGVQIGSETSRSPINTYTVTMQFVSEPARRVELIKAAFAVVDSLKRSPPSAEELHKVIAPTLRERETARKTNGYWLGILNLYRLDRPLSDIVDDSRVSATSPTQVQEAARQYLDTTRYQEFDLIPVSH